MLCLALNDLQRGRHLDPLSFQERGRDKPVWCAHGIRTVIHVVLKVEWTMQLFGGCDKQLLVSRLRPDRKLALVMHFHALDYSSICLDR